MRELWTLKKICTERNEWRKRSKRRDGEKGGDKQKKRWRERKTGEGEREIERSKGEIGGERVRGAKERRDGG